MPAYPWLLTEDLDFEQIQSRVKAMSRLGVPYSEEEIENAAQLAREQAREIKEKLVSEDATYAESDLERKKVIALTAYMLRLGTDITKPPPEESADEAATE
jgi:cytochrome c oxidase cbb3-type subunit I/II